ncbi:MAG: diguanylate cyclase, partial [Gammaproteobacteria bacterium]|nr:diguanylate cyclase [Gammaproteobacteria bacterium]
LLLEIKLNDFFEYAISNVFDDEGLKVKLEEVNSNLYLAGEQWLEKSKSWYYQAEQIIDTSTTDEIHVEYTGQLWRIRIVAPAHFNEQMSMLEEKISLIIGVIITLLVTLIIFIQQRQTLKIQVQVQERTRELALSEAISRSILESAADAIFSVDDNGIISRLNPAAIELCSYDENELIGKSIKKIIPECGIDDDSNCRLDKFTKEKAVETVVLGKNDKKTIVKLSIRDIGYEGQFKYICMMHDLTEIKVVQQTLESLSQTDPLTKLYNRRYFDEQMKLVWKQAVRDKSPISLMMLDIDHFKLYNDFYGHTKGDECLQQISQTLKLSFNRSIDLVARYGGEEFIILLPNTTDVESMATRCIENVRELAIPHEKSFTSNIVSFSMGINTIIPKYDDSILKFISNADSALYKAKKKGRNQYQVYING